LVVVNASKRKAMSYPRMEGEVGRLEPSATPSTRARS